MKNQQNEMLIQNINENNESCIVNMQNIQYNRTEKPMLIVIKIGTDSVIGNIVKIVHDIVNLKKQGHNIIMVSSGAVGTGRLIYKNLGNSPVEKQILASLGQVDLMMQYKLEFQKYEYHIGQILITKKDIESKAEIENLENMMQKMLIIGNIIPIINENDSIALRELMFTDNDEIAGMLAGVFGADKLIILTNVDGVYDDFISPNRKILHNIKYDDNIVITQEKSSMGRGGMYSKVNVAKKLAKVGISTTICNIKIENILQKVISGFEVGTNFISQRKTKASKIRRTLAFEPGVNIYGSIVINKCLEEKIKKSTSAFSILPIGITSFNGIFNKNNLVEIKTTTNTIIGYGLAGFTSNELSHYIGKENVKPFIRYEYMYIF